jgi:hypothetical protein
MVVKPLGQETGVTFMMDVCTRGCNENAVLDASASGEIRAGSECSRVSGCAMALILTWEDFVVVGVLTE